jgi:hypothetical protein
MAKYIKVEYAAAAGVTPAKQRGGFRSKHKLVAVGPPQSKFEG